MHHLGVGHAHARRRFLAIADDTTVTVIEIHTAQVLSQHQIQPEKTYWRNTQKPRADGPELNETRPMSRHRRDTSRDSSHGGG